MATSTPLLDLLDLLLTLVFLIITVAVPLLDSQLLFPVPVHPKPLLDVKAWYVHAFGDYLVSEKPLFFVGLVWAELAILWPASVSACYAFFARRPWFKTACLVAGVSTATSMSAIMSELLGSGRGSEKLYQMYGPFALFSVLAVLRGFLPSTTYSKKTSGGKGHAGRKKRA